MLFWYGVVAFPVNLMIILGESWVNDHALRFWEYDASQYAWMLMIAGFNFIGVCCQTVAAQNERSGFVTLLCYIGLVYAVIGDFLIFSEIPNLLEAVGVGVILILNIIVVYSKWESPEEVTDSNEEKASIKANTSSSKLLEEV